MEKTTINGKSLAQIAAEFRAPFAQECFDTNDADGTPYIPVEVFEKRFNDTVGMLNYNKEVSPARLMEVAGKASVAVTMTISLLDDNGQNILTRSSNGAKDVIIVKETGKPKSLKSDISGAESDAFKQICKSFGIGVDQLRDLAFNKKKKNGGAYHGNAQQTEEDTAFTVTLNSPFSRGNKFISATGTDQKGQTVKVMIFERNFPEIEKKCPVENFIAGVKPGCTICFTGKYSTFNNTLQAIFSKDLARPAA